MIRKLKIKFILLCAASIFVLLSLIVTGMNVINYNSVVKEADEILSLLSQNEGKFPEDIGEKPHKLPPSMSPELPFESRYFSVLISQNGNTVGAETSRIASIDTKTAIEYAKNIAASKRQHGFVYNFRFQSKSENNILRITFLDCSRNLDSFKSFLVTSILMSFLGFVVVLFVIIFLAEKIIKPISESYQKQKRFITDASHEIKTPLTIIAANADVLEIDMGDNEYLADIKHQTKRLTDLTNELVYLARMEESENHINKIDFPISDIINEAAASFKTLAETQNKTLICRITPMLSMYGNDKSITVLVNILLENAVKYSPEGDTITLDFYKQARQLKLCVCNNTLLPVKSKELSLVFDRFYRIDSSRSQETGGYGIGLSTAKAIIEAHSGKVSLQTKDGHSFNICVTFPI